MPSRPADDLTADDRQQGVRLLRRHHRGTLQMHERTSEIKIVVEASTGRIVAAVEPGLAKATLSGDDSLLLWLPREDDWDVQVSVVARQIERPEATEAVDRWSAYHGASASSTWVRCEIDGAKTRRSVYIGEELEQPNPLGRAEYGLIKRANADREALAAACKRHAAMLVADALCVGADPFGLDIRARFGIVRLEFPDGIVASTLETCDREIARLLGIGAGAPGGTTP